MKKKFLRKSLNICTSCYGRGSMKFTKFMTTKDGKVTTRQVGRLCTNCYGEGVAIPEK